MKYFKKEEFMCLCGDCGECEISPELAERLDALRFHAGIPVRVNSGRRCRKHNEEVGGAKGSSHLTGDAADLRADTPAKYYAILRGAFAAGFRRIGLGKRFIHVDVDSAKPQDIIWTSAY